MTQETSDITVSVCMITYNHEKFIRQAIEGVLMQQTDFPIELVIGEDCSTDSTRALCVEYADKHPEIIRLLPSDNNLGIMPNFIKTLQACTGKYIALCEGDDYWTDPLKLKKQVEFLEKNDAYAGIANQVYVQYDNILINTHLYRINTKDKLALNDFVGSLPFHTSSFLFRKVLLNGFLPPEGITSGDRSLFTYIAGKGNIKFLDQPMGVYRRNTSSISHNLMLSSFINDIKIGYWIKSLYPNFEVKRFLSFLFYTRIWYPKEYSFLFFISNFSKHVFYSLLDSPFNIRYLIQENLLFKVLKSKKIKSFY